MDPDLISRLLTLLPLLAVTVAFVVALAALLTWVLGRAAGSEALMTANAVNAVTLATALRRDRRQTLGRILEIAQENLAAESGALILGQGRETWSVSARLG
jgi:hypothetical protein